MLKKDIDMCINILLDTAYEGYANSKEYRIYQANISEKENKLSSELTEKQKITLYEFIDEIYVSIAGETETAYKQGLKDSVEILKLLGAFK